MRGALACKVHWHEVTVYWCWVMAGMGLGVWGLGSGPPQPWTAGVSSLFAQRLQNQATMPSYRAWGGITCPVKFAVVNFAVGIFTETPGFRVVYFADTPRNFVVLRVADLVKLSHGCYSQGRGDPFATLCGDEG